MALIFDGFQNLAGKALPNVRIEDITLSVGNDPEIESNPHINSSREVQFVGISNNIAVQQPTTTQKQIQNKNFFCDVKVSMLNVETLNNSLVLNQINFLDFVYVKVIQSLSQALTNELISSNFPVDYTKLKNTNDYSEKLFKLSDFYDNKILDLQSNNAKVYKHLKDVRFTSKNPNKQHLDIFAFAYLNIDELVNSFELNIPSGFDVKGYVSKESVISNSQTNTTSYILTDNQNNIFIGTPIKGKNGKFYKTKPISIAAEATTQPLNMATILNKKVFDNRDLMSLQNENFANTPIKIVTPQIDLYKQKDKKYLSELYSSRQTDNSYSFLLLFDLISYLKSLSQTPEIYDDIRSLDLIKVKKLSITRKRVKTIDSIVYNFSEYTPDSMLISTSEKVFGNISNNISYYDFYNNKYTTNAEDLQSGKFGSNLPSFATLENLRKIATISEITLPNALGFRTFTFTDYEISKLTTGEYKYKVDIEIEDQTRVLIEQKIQTLKNACNKLKEYLSQAERIDMFSEKENKQKQKFVNLQNSKYNNVNLNVAITAGTINQNLNIQNAPWIEISSIIASFENKNLANDAKHYYSLLNPTTTNPTKINNVINKINSLITETNKKYNLEEISDKNTKSSNSKPNKIITLSHTFDKVIDSELKKVGIDFLNPTTTERNLLSAGPLVIPSQQFSDRINTEILKYFPTQQPSLLTLKDSLTPEDISELSDITTFSSCYFSPAIAVVDKQQIKLDTFDSTNLNFSNYDTIVNKSISTNNKSDSRVNNELLSKTSVSLNTIKNFSTNLNSSVQLSFINKDSLHVDANTIFDNSGFNTQNITLNINDICKISNQDDKNEKTLSSLSSLTNLLLDDYIRPSSVNDTINDVVSINTIDRFNLLSSTSMLSSIKEKNEVKSKPTTTNIPVSLQPINSLQKKKESNGIFTANKNITIDSSNSKTLKNIPLQTKSLMMGSVTKTKFNLQSFNFDPFKHPETKNFMRLNFQTICQIEYLSGFEVINNVIDINKPIWTLLTKQEYDNLQGLIVIKTKQYSNKLYNIGTETNLNFDIYNEYSIIDKSEVRPTLQAAQQMQMPQINIVPNFNLNINNVNVNTNNILNNLTIPNMDLQQIEIIKQLAVVNLIDKEIKTNYTFSKLELDNVNK